MSVGERFVNFVNQTPTVFHFGTNVRERLISEGYTELKEEEEWKEIPQKGFVIRESRELIAFNYTKTDKALIVGTHCDSPCFNLKPNQKKVSNSLKVFNVSPYGGGLWPTWFDRDLKVAGRVFYEEDGKILWKLYDSKDPIAFIPNPSEKKLSLESHFNPIFGTSKSIDFIEFLAQSLQIESKSIVSFDLFLVDSYESSIIGVNDQFIASPRIDNLSSTFTALEAFLNSQPNESINILAVFDHEEVGSDSRFGANGNLLFTVLKEICGSENSAYECLANSFLISSDCSHGVHPNYSHVHEVRHRPECGKGTALKQSPGSSYATNLESSSFFIRAVEKSGFRVQKIINRNDVPGGSTIGPGLSSQLGVLTADIGLPQLAMHSIREFMAIADLESQIKILTDLYNSFSGI